MEITIVTFVLAFVCVLWSIICAKKHRKKWSYFKDIPRPELKTLPVLGVILTGSSGELYRRRIGKMQERAGTTADEIGVIQLAHVPIVYIFGPNSAETLLRSSQHTAKSVMYRFLHPWLATGLLTSSGEKWKTRRRLLTPTFHFSILNDFLSVMNEQATILTKKLETYADNHESFDVWNPITMCTLDIICETAMGKPINAQTNEDQEYVMALKAMADLVTKRAKRPWLWPEFLFWRTKDGKSTTRCLSVLHGFTKSVINERKTSHSSPKQPMPKRRLAFLDMLLNVSDGGKVLSDHDIQEEVDTFMFEGHDTTAAGISLSLHLIGSHPDIQKKIQDELDEVLRNFDSHDISMEDLKKLEYLEMVTKECLRLFPPVPVIGRVTSAECVMDGHILPTGTNCMLYTQAVNKNPNYWTDPDSFDPERFSADNSVGRHPYSFLPFSAGPRNCIGQKFAMMEEKVVLAHLLKAYSIESCQSTEDLQMTPGLILRAKNGIYVKLKKR